MSEKILVMIDIKIELDDENKYFKICDNALFSSEFITIILENILKDRKYSEINEEKS